MNSDKATLATVVAIMPTENKSVSYETAKEIIRHLVGSVYEDVDASNDCGNPTNISIYCKILTDDEKNAINIAMNNVGIMPIYLQGKTEDFEKCDNSTIVVR